MKESPGTSSAATEPAGEPLTLDPLPLLRDLASLRRLTGMYPPGHPVISQKLNELYAGVQQHLHHAPVLRIEIVYGDVHLDGVSFSHDASARTQVVRELTDLGIDSIQIGQGVEPAELHAVAEHLWQIDGSGGRQAVEEPVAAQLLRRGVRHVSLGRLVPLDTRWRARQWSDRPTGPLDPAYEASLDLTERAFDTVAAGRDLDAVTVRDLVHLLIYKVAASDAALGQILAVKLYENLTYCHSVNVAMLSLLLGRQVGLSDRAINVLVEAALLHDIGKTRIPIEILKKPGALDRRERRLIEAHTTFGAEILVEIDGLHPLTPTVALEHHRSVRGSGYPDLGEGAIPHVMSQIVSVADIYEALTGARSYQDPTLPEQACLILARLRGDKLSAPLVKAFVSAVTFFPLGSRVRTNRGEIGVVVRTNPTEPLHPVIALMNDGSIDPATEIDTSRRDDVGEYQRHIVETLRPEPDRPSVSVRSC